MTQGARGGGLRVYQRLEVNASFVRVMEKC